MAQSSMSVTRLKCPLNAKGQVRPASRVSFLLQQSGLCRACAHATEMP